MKVIYDSAGTIIATDLTPIDTTKTITGTLYSIDVTVPEGKVIDHVDVSNLPHVPVFVDAPKTPQEYTNEQIQKLMPQLARNDMAHDEAIENINSVLEAIKSKTGQLEADVTVLKKGAE